MNKRVVNEILTSVVALVLALAVAGLAVLLAGHNPLVAVQALLHGAFGSAENIGDTINRTTPLILTGLAVAFAFRSGLFNIGGEGQYLLGGMGAVAAAIAFPHLSPFLLVPLSLICGAAAGAIWGALAAWLKSRFGVHEVISTIMLNWCAFYLVSFLVTGTSLKDPVGGEGTYKVPLTGVVPRLIGTNIYTGIFVALALAALVWFILKRTWVGYEIGAA
ncbi:MAG TPA: ABC transporter permease, partial [Candidatus Xenobia bacterium]